MKRDLLSEVLIADPGSAYQAGLRALRRRRRIRRARNGLLLLCIAAGVGWAIQWPKQAIEPQPVARAREIPRESVVSVSKRSVVPNAPVLPPDREPWQISLRGVVQPVGDSDFLAALRVPAALVAIDDARKILVFTKSEDEKAVFGH